MTVSEISRNKVKIVLTKTEVLCCFGTYEKLINMTQTTKAIICALLREIVQEHYSAEKHDSIYAEIHARRNSECVIILTVKNSKMPTHYIFEFPNSECLIKAALFMQNKNNFNKHNSQLYKMPCSYRIIIESFEKPEYFFTLKEFYCKTLIGSSHKEYTKEYGTPIATENAVFKIAKAFY